MIKIQPANVDKLVTKVMKKETNSVSFVQKQCGKFVGAKGYVFASDEMRNYVAEKIKEYAKLPEECGDLFVSIV